MTTLQKAFAVTLAVAVGVGIYEANQSAALRYQVAALRHQQIFRSREIQRLQREWNDATNSQADLSFTNGDHVRGNITGILTDPNFRMVIHAL